ncbi:tyrosine-type recombinase/integrase [Variovorax sp. J31P179]|uniref:tyrosine-type recombinase/integrase n=1 Tax=Variovorax sp. J31P179 TaxID=3053508 RepID=UPI0025784161|nr:tyrosine-type recombinase/integrase [Variovorax sp. J31P179]MDM0082915.1 tyrosine-type recombinase/integrase [Variovorax sp. J31P179]
MKSESRLLVSEVSLGADRPGFLVYDLQARRLVAEISDYAQVMLADRFYSSFTVEQGLNHLVEFWQHLLETRGRLNRVSDAVIREFRDQNLAKVKASAAHRGSDNHAKATVNLKLCRIYDWLIWLQQARRVPVGTVGRTGLVTALIEAQSYRPVRGGKWRRGERKYPLLFKLAGSNAKHNVPASVITNEHVASLLSLFIERHEPYVAQRNILFIDIAETTGFRRGSICSLTVEQFAIEAIERSKEEFLVRPSRQKFGYTNTFGIPLDLAYRIRQFIDEHWLPWVGEKKTGDAVHNGRLFLSAKTGGPITDRAMTQIVSAGFRELGLDKGIGPHRLRAKFTSEQSDQELAERKELGLDTSNMSIAADLAMKLGHTDPTQYYRYASSSQARQARIARDGRAAELKALRQENKDLKLSLEKRATRGHRNG